MITAASLLPHPPVLFRELCGSRDPVARLRRAVRDAVHEVTQAADTVVLVGGADDGRRWDAALGTDLRGYGTTATPRPEESLPLSLGVGSRLLDESGWRGPVVAQSIGWAAQPRELDDLALDLTGRRDRTAVLVLGDGSARRSLSAPGYLDDRAFAFDDAVAKALTDGDAVALATLDTELAADLMARGAAALRFLGALGLRVSSPPLPRMLHREDPFGVDYCVATWRF